MDPQAPLDKPDLPPPPQVEQPFCCVIFGASGDLTARKLLPALFALDRLGSLPERYHIVGVARRPMSDEEFRARMDASLARYARSPSTSEERARFLARLSYQAGDSQRAADMHRLGRHLAELEAREGLGGGRLYYLALAERHFGPTVRCLDEAGLLGGEAGRDGRRVVIEKPFGHDAGSAAALDRQIRQHLEERQIYRIDHYLGKETVQNILSFRFGNAIFEPLFNSRYVEHVQITAAETLGMEQGRGAYYDQAGALRDMVQNHLLQLLCLVAMEPPSGLRANEVRDEKVKVLRSVRPLGEEQLLRQVVRGQYAAGPVAEGSEPGYRAADGVAPDSDTETFVALRLGIESWRWAGVPFLLRTGKRLPRRLTEIAIQFRRPPLRLFTQVACKGDVCDITEAQPNQLVFRIQPDEGISLTFNCKRPGMHIQLEQMKMGFLYNEGFSVSSPEAYERLLLDALRGDSTLFTRSDEVAAAWDIVTPILEAARQRPALRSQPYAPGTWGPAAADALFAGLSGGWRNH